MGYFDLTWFVLQYAEKHGIQKTREVIAPFVPLFEDVKVKNVPEHEYDKLAEELVKRY